MNAWNPVLSMATRANHDVKLLTNGEATRDISFYITSYAAKNQHHTSNVSALLAKTYAYQSASSKRVDDEPRNLNRRLIERCANSLTREQELSAPEVVSYVMGWGDRYISHQFQPMFFSSVIFLLKKIWPTLNDTWYARRQSFHISVMLMHM